MSCEFYLPINILLVELLLRQVCFGQKPHNLGDLHFLWPFSPHFSMFTSYQHPPRPENPIKNEKNMKHLLGEFTSKNVLHCEICLILTLAIIIISVHDMYTILLLIPKCHICTHR